MERGECVPLPIRSTGGASGQERGGRMEPSTWLIGWRPCSGQTVDSDQVGEVVFPEH